MIQACFQGMNAHPDNPQRSRLLHEGEVDYAAKLVIAAARGLAAAG
ncbi:hypothetical protein [Pseudarthrobacter sp. Y6]